MCPRESDEREATGAGCAPEFFSLFFADPHRGLGEQVPQYLRRAALIRLRARLRMAPASVGSKRWLGIAIDSLIILINLDSHP